MRENIKVNPAKKIFCVLIFLFLFIPVDGQAESNPAHYLISLGDYGKKGEVTGYECLDDNICNIKFLTSKSLVVIADIWFANKMGLVLFKRNLGDDKYKYFTVASAHQDEQEYLAINLKEPDCVKEPVILFEDGDVAAKLNIMICPKK